MTPRALTRGLGGPGEEALGATRSLARPMPRVEDLAGVPWGLGLGLGLGSGSAFGMRVVVVEQPDNGGSTGRLAIGLP